MIDIKEILRQETGRNYALHDAHINPRFAKVLKTIGFDKCYTRGEGAYLWDEKGRQYLDMLSGYGVFNMGRNHPDIIKVLQDYLETGSAALVQMEAPLLSGLLAAELKKRMPKGLDKVYFTSTGAEGVETAIKFAHCATGRPGILHTTKSFHGLTTGALSLNGDEVFRSGFSPLTPETRKIPYDDLGSLETELVRGDVAALIVEPVQGKGVNIPSPDYLRQAAALCHQHGALFIADEVQSGMGRTGTFLALEQEEEVEPDMVILSKSLSGGFVPVGAVLTRDWIYDKVFSSLDRAVVHSSTFGQGGFAMAAGLAALDVIDRHDLMGNANRMGDLLGSELQKMAGEFELIKDVRWRGLMMAIEFGEPKSWGLKTGWTMAHKLDKSLFPQAITIPLLEDHGVLTQTAGHHIDVIKLLPPLVLSEDDVSWFLEGFRDVMKKIHRFPGPAWEVISRVGKHSLKSKTKKTRQAS